MTKTIKNALIFILMIIAVLTLACCGSSNNDGEASNTSSTVSVKDGADGKDGVDGVDGADGKDFWVENPQGLDFYPQDDGSLAVGVGNAKLLSQIVVPKTFMEKPITEVISDGFANLTKLESITLPDSVDTFGENAFTNSTKLKKIIIGEKQLTPIAFSASSTKFNNFKISSDTFKNTKFLTVDVKNSTDNDTVADVEIKNIPENVTKIKITYALNATTDYVWDKEFDTAYKTELSTTIDFHTFGRFEKITIEAYNGETLVSTLDAADVTISADEYSFAYLNASYPVLVYSLKLNEITNGGKIPSFVFLERTAAYDWDNLMYGVSPFKFLTKQQATNGTFHANREPVANYIKSLYEINPQAKFNLYLVDNYPEMILQMLVANKIPESQWKAVILSDGSGTAGLLSSTFAVDNPQAKYNDMVNNWKTIKDMVYKNGYNSEKLNAVITYKNAKGSSEYQLLERYPYIVSSFQSNVTWWVNRLRTGENLASITAKDATFAQNIVNSVTSYYTNNLLAALSEDDKVAFKQMYHFSDEMFAEADNSGKKPMIILGTSWAGESASFYNYLRLTMDFYGDEYVYYYKGHPGYPTATTPDRQVELDKLEADGYTIYELDCSIAAEVILFYKPSAYLSGWQSTTFDSVENQTMACALYNVSLASMSSFTYGKYIDLFITMLPQSTATYSNLTLNAEHTYYLLEFNNQSEYTNQTENYAKHEIAIFDATEKTIKYYKLQTEAYVEVNADGSAKA